MPRWWKSLFNPDRHKGNIFPCRRAMYVPEFNAYSRRSVTLGRFIYRVPFAIKGERLNHAIAMCRSTSTHWILNRPSSTEDAAILHARHEPTRCATIEDITGTSADTSTWLRASTKLHFTGVAVPAGLSTEHTANILYSFKSLDFIDVFRATASNACIAARTDVIPDKPWTFPGGPYVPFRNRLVRPTA